MINQLGTLRTPWQGTLYQSEIDRTACLFPCHQNTVLRGRHASVLAHKAQHIHPNEPQ
jgi:hypothetical protein